ncbi:MAG: hypothetical protein MUC87_03090 [Bacteroidia bacterium]|jgi:hypothetical protein|nr:hypothetical protein [Bacteroidia bacterium]
MSELFEQSGLLKIARKRLLHLGIIGVAAAVCGFIFSGETFIKPRFKSMAVVYPVNIIPYSSETPSEQLLQLFRSTDVREMMVRRFKLEKVYGIDTSAKAGKARLLACYEENVEVRKTEFESVQIYIYDTNPDSACAMVKSLITFVNLKARSLQREKTLEVVNIFKGQLQQKQMQIDTMEKQMQLLRQNYGLLDYKSQAREVTRGILKNDGRNAKADTLFKNLQIKGGDLLWYSDQLDQLRKDFGDVRSEYDRALSDLTKELTYSNVVASPYPADSKSYPVRWLIVAIATGSALFLGFLLFVLLDSKRNSATHAA